MDAPDAVLSPLELPMGSIEAKDGEYIIQHSLQDDRPISPPAPQANVPQTEKKQEPAEDLTSEITVGEEEIAMTLRDAGYGEYIGDPKVTQGVGYVLSTYDFNFKNQFDLQDLGSYSEKNAVIQQMIDGMEAEAKQREVQVGEPNDYSGDWVGLEASKAPPPVKLVDPLILSEPQVWWHKTELEVGVGEAEPTAELVDHAFVPLTRKEHFDFMPSDLMEEYDVHEMFLQQMAEGRIFDEGSEEGIPQRFPHDEEEEVGVTETIGAAMMKLKHTEMDGNFHVKGDIVEIPGDPDHPCRGSSCTGSMKFTIGCPEVDIVQFQMSVITPNDNSDSIYIRVNNGTKLKWLLFEGEKWHWSRGSPNFQLEPGLSNVELIAREDNIKFRDIRMIQGRCMFRLIKKTKDLVWELPRAKISPAVLEFQANDQTVGVFGRQWTAIREQCTGILKLEGQFRFASNTGRVRPSYGLGKWRPVSCLPYFCEDPWRPVCMQTTMIDMDKYMAGFEDVCWCENPERMTGHPPPGCTCKERFHPEFGLKTAECDTSSLVLGNFKLQSPWCYVRGNCKGQRRSTALKENIAMCVNLRRGARVVLEGISDYTFTGKRREVFTIHVPARHFLAGTKTIGGILIILDEDFEPIARIDQRLKDFRVPNTRMADQLMTILYIVPNLVKSTRVYRLTAHLAKIAMLGDCSTIRSKKDCILSYDARPSLQSDCCLIDDYPTKGETRCESFIKIKAMKLHNQAVCMQLGMELMLNHEDLRESEQKWVAAMSYMNMSSIEGYQFPQYALFSDLDWRRPDLLVYGAQTRRSASPWFQVEFQVPVIVGTINFRSPGPALVTSKGITGTNILHEAEGLVVALGFGKCSEPDGCPLQRSFLCDHIISHQDANYYSVDCKKQAASHIYFVLPGEDRVLKIADLVVDATLLISPGLKVELHKFENKKVNVIADRFQGKPKAPLGPINPYNPKCIVAASAKKRSVWRMELPEATYFDHIRIWFYHNVYFTRIPGFRVTVDGESCSDNVDLMLRTYHLDLECSKKGKVLEISVPPNTPLNLCNVELFLIPKPSCSHDVCEECMMLEARTKKNHCTKCAKDSLLVDDTCKFGAIMLRNDFQPNLPAPKKYPKKRRFPWFQYFVVEFAIMLEDFKVKGEIFKFTVEGNRVFSAVVAKGQIYVYYAADQAVCRAPLDKDPKSWQKLKLEYFSREFNLMLDNVVLCTAEHRIKNNADSTTFQSGPEINGVTVKDLIYRPSTRSGEKLMTEALNSVSQLGQKGFRREVEIHKTFLLNFDIWPMAFPKKRHVFRITPSDKKIKYCYPCIDMIGPEPQLRFAITNVKGRRQGCMPKARIPADQYTQISVSYEQDFMKVEYNGVLQCSVEVKALYDIPLEGIMFIGQHHKYKNGLAFISGLTYGEAPSELCPQGYNYVENMCYKPSETELSIDDAKEECESYGGSIATIRTGSANQYLQNLFGSRRTTMHTNIWIGIKAVVEGPTIVDSRDPNLANYQWMDGKECNYTNWEDEGAYDTKKCVYLQSTTGKWLQDDCKAEKMYVCSLPPTCPGGYKLQGDRCSKYYYNRETYFGAERKCKEDFGSLFRYREYEEITTVTQLANRIQRGVWFGCEDEDSMDCWVRAGKKALTEQDCRGREWLIEVRRKDGRSTYQVGDKCKDNGKESQQCCLPYGINPIKCTHIGLKMGRKLHCYPKFSGEDMNVKLVTSEFPCDTIVVSSRLKRHKCSGIYKRTKQIIGGASVFENNWRFIWKEKGTWWCGKEAGGKPIMRFLMNGNGDEVQSGGTEMKVGTNSTGGNSTANATKPVTWEENGSVAIECAKAQTCKEVEVFSKVFPKFNGIYKKWKRKYDDSIVFSAGKDKEKIFWDPSGQWIVNSRKLSMTFNSMMYELPARGADFQPHSEKERQKDWAHDDMAILRCTTVCKDVPGWFDEEGKQYTCKWYEKHNRCNIYGSKFANGGATAQMACCACGGGIDVYQNSYKCSEEPIPRSFCAVLGKKCRGYACYNHEWRSLKKVREKGGMCSGNCKKDSGFGFHYKKKKGGKKKMPSQTKAAVMKALPIILKMSNSLRQYSQGQPSDVPLKKVMEAMPAIKKMSEGLEKYGNQERQKFLKKKADKEAPGSHEDNKKQEAKEQGEDPELSLASLKKLEKSVNDMLRRKRELNKKVLKQRAAKKQEKQDRIDEATERRFKQALRRKKKSASESEVAWGRLRKGTSKRKILKQLKDKSNDELMDSYEKVKGAVEDSSDDDSVEDIESGVSPDQDDETRRRLKRDKLAEYFGESDISLYGGSRSHRHPHHSRRKKRHRHHSAMGDLDIPGSAREENARFKRQIERLATHPHFGKDIRNSLKALKRDEKLVSELPDFRRNLGGMDWSELRHRIKKRRHHRKKRSDLENMYHTQDTMDAEERRFRKQIAKLSRDPLESMHPSKGKKDIISAMQQLKRDEEMISDELPKFRRRRLKRYFDEFSTHSHHHHARHHSHHRDRSDIQTIYQAQDTMDAEEKAFRAKIRSLSRDPLESMRPGRAKSKILRMMKSLKDDEEMISNELPDFRRRLEEGIADYFKAKEDTLNDFGTANSFDELWNMYAPKAADEVKVKTVKKTNKVCDCESGEEVEVAGDAVGCPCDKKEKKKKSKSKKKSNKKSKKKKVKKKKHKGPNVDEDGNKTDGWKGRTQKNDKLFKFFKHSTPIAFGKDKKKLSYFDAAGEDSELGFKKQKGRTSSARRSFVCSTNAWFPDAMHFAESLPDYDDSIFDDDETAVAGHAIKAGVSSKRPMMFRVPQKPQYLKAQSIVSNYLTHKKDYHAWPAHLHMREGDFHHRRSLLTKEQIGLFPEHAHRRFLYIPVGVNDLLKIGGEKGVGEIPTACPGGYQLCSWTQMHTLQNERNYDSTCMYGKYNHGFFALGKECAVGDKATHMHCCESYEADEEAVGITTKFDKLAKQWHRETAKIRRMLYAFENLFKVVTDLDNMFKMLLEMFGKMCPMLDELIQMPYIGDFYLTLKNAMNSFRCKIPALHAPIKAAKKELLRLKKEIFDGITNVMERMDALIEPVKNAAQFVYDAVPFFKGELRKGDLIPWGTILTFHGHPPDVDEKLKKPGEGASALIKAEYICKLIIKAATKALKAVLQEVAKIKPPQWIMIMVKKFLTYAHALSKIVKWAKPYSMLDDLKFNFLLPTKGCYGLKDSSTNSEIAVGSANALTAERFFSDEIIFDENEEIPVGAGIDDDAAELISMLDHFEENGIDLMSMKESDKLKHITKYRLSQEVGVGVADSPEFHQYLENEFENGPVSHILDMVDDGFYDLAGDLLQNGEFGEVAVGSGGATQKMEQENTAIGGTAENPIPHLVNTATLQTRDNDWSAKEQGRGMKQSGVLKVPRTEINKAFVSKSDKSDKEGNVEVDLVGVAQRKVAGKSTLKDIAQTRKGQTDESTVCSTDPENQLTVNDQLGSDEEYLKENGTPELEKNEERRSLRELAEWRVVLRSKNRPRRRMRRKTAENMMSGGVSNFDPPKRKVRWGNMNLGTGKLAEKVQLSTNNAGRVLGKVKTGINKAARNIGKQVKSAARWVGKLVKNLSKWLAKGLGCLIPQWRPVTMMGLTRIVKIFFPELVQETILVPLTDLQSEMDLSDASAEGLDEKSMEVFNKALQQTLALKPKHKSVESAVSHEFQHADPSELANAVNVLGEDNLMKAIASKVRGGRHVRAEVAVGEAVESDDFLNVPHHENLEHAFDALGSLQEHISDALSTGPDSEKLASVMQDFSEDGIVSQAMDRLTADDETAVGVDENAVGEFDLGDLMQIPGHNENLQDALDAFGHLEDHVHAALQGSPDSQTLADVMHEISSDGVVSQAMGKLQTDGEEMAVGDDDTDYDAALKVFGKGGLQEIQDQIALQAENDRDSKKKEEREQATKKDKPIGDWNDDDGPYMLHERSGDKKPSGPILDKQKGGPIPAQVLAPFKRLLSSHLQRILWSLDLWIPFPMFTAKAVRLAYPPESVAPLMGLAKMEDNGEKKVQKLFGEGKLKKYGILIMKDALKKGAGDNIPDHIEEIVQKLIDANLDEAKKLAKANALKKLKKRREFMLVKLRQKEYEKIMKKKKATKKEGKKELETQMAKALEEKQGWGKVEDATSKGKNGKLATKLSENEDGWGVLDDEDEEKFLAKQLENSRDDSSDDSAKEKSPEKSQPKTENEKEDDWNLQKFQPEKESEKGWGTLPGDEEENTGKSDEKTDLDQDEEREQTPGKETEEEEQADDEDDEAESDWEDLMSRRRLRRFR